MKKSKHVLTAHGLLETGFGRAFTRRNIVSLMVIGLIFFVAPIASAQEKIPIVMVMAFIIATVLVVVPSIGQAMQ